MSESPHRRPVEDASPTEARAWLRRAVGSVRVEEWVLLALWAVLIGACAITGTGFTFEPVASRYVQYFAIYILVLVAVARASLPLVDAWRPTTARWRAIKRWVFGERRGLEPLLEVDLELVRGFFVLVVSLTVYTNVKVRLPALRFETYDAAFSALDSALFAGVPDALRSLAQHDRAAKVVLADLFTHDWFYVMGIVYLGYFRRDIRLMRWVFNTVAFVYVLAMVVALGVPTEAPFYVDPSAYTWSNGTSSERAQDYLLDFRKASNDALAYRTPFRVKAFTGIVAFPGVDVAQLMVAAVIGWRVWRPYGVLSACVLLGVWAGYLAFGWGYAIDGIAGVALALVCAAGVGTAVGWRRPANLASTPASTPTGEAESQ
jgi:hypothetical protein